MSAEHHNATDDALLSAYVDHALDTAERAALEARLERDPDLRRKLAELRQTVALLRDLPPLKAPRDFSLTREMLAQASEPSTDLPDFVRGQPAAAAARPARPRRVIAFPLVTAISTAASVILMIAGLLILAQPDDATTGTDVAMNAEPSVVLAPTLPEAAAGAAFAETPPSAASPAPAEPAEAAEEASENGTGAADDAAFEAAPAATAGDADSRPPEAAALPEAEAEAGEADMDSFGAGDDADPGDETADGQAPAADRGATVPVTPRVEAPPPAGAQPATDDDTTQPTLTPEAASVEEAPQAGETTDHRRTGVLLLGAGAALLALTGGAWLVLRRA